MHQWVSFPDLRCCCSSAVLNTQTCYHSIAPFDSALGRMKPSGLVCTHGFHHNAHTPVDQHTYCRILLLLSLHSGPSNVACSPSHRAGQA